MKSKKIFFAIALLSGSALAILFWATSVEVDVKDSEKKLITKYISQNGISVDNIHGSFDTQISFIKAVNNLLINKLKQKKHKKLSLSVKKLLNTNYGVCYDRSFLLEKILKVYGFQTRHVYAVDLSEYSNSFIYNFFFVKNLPSHAISEVYTKQGWLIVDSSYNWISLDSNNNPVSFQKLKKLKSIDWKYQPEDRVKKMFYDTSLMRSYFIYGLYSRHGNFFYPFLLSPEIEYREFLSNLI